MFVSLVSFVTENIITSSSDDSNQDNMMAFVIMMNQMPRFYYQFLSYHIPYCIIDLKQHNRLKAGTNKPKPVVGPRTWVVRHWKCSYKLTAAL